MPERTFHSSIIRRFPTKLIMVIEQDEEVGRQFVQMIRRETPFQAILAMNLPQAHNILLHLKCDLFLLTDNTLPEDDLERLYLLPEGIEPPALLDLALFSCNYQNNIDMKNIVKTLELLFSVHDAPVMRHGLKNQLISSQKRIWQHQE